MLDNIHNSINSIIKTGIIGLVFAPLVRFLELYVFGDWVFLLNLCVLICIDTILGIAVSIKFKKLSSNGFSKLFNKIIVYMLLLIATHTAAHSKVGSIGLEVFVWLDTVIYSTIMIRELLSIFEKTSLLGYFQVPKWILAKLELFDEKGEIPQYNKPTINNNNEQLPS